jgi:hypothetical protein
MAFTSLLWVRDTQFPSLSVIGRASGWHLVLDFPGPWWRWIQSELRVKGATLGIPVIMQSAEEKEVHSGRAGRGGRCHAALPSRL